MPSHWRRCSSTTESSGSCCGLAGVGWGWGGSLRGENTSCKAVGPLELIWQWAQRPLLTHCTAGYTEARVACPRSHSQMSPISLAYSSLSREVTIGIFGLLALGPVLRRTSREKWREQETELCPGEVQLGLGKQLRSDGLTTANYSHTHTYTPPIHPHSHLHQTCTRLPTMALLIALSVRNWGQVEAGFPWRGAHSSQSPSDHMEIGK